MCRVERSNRVMGLVGFRAFNEGFKGNFLTIGT